MKSFPNEDREKVELTWLHINSGIAKVSTLYSLPQTPKQAALLFSHDGERLAASLAWFAEVVERIRPSSVIELGCGAGYVLRYLRHIHPTTKLAGIDRQENLLRVIPQEDQIRTFAGDYRTLKSDGLNDLVICDFGWDNSDIPASLSPHSKAQIGGLTYCPGCSDDAVPFFRHLINACQTWAADAAHIAVTGRLSNIGMIRAVYCAAEEQGWKIVPEKFEVRVLTYGRSTKEKFPSLVLSRATDGGLSLEDIAEAYAAA
ncbi:class I SAM-dependent methyltransferase [Sinorhizobium fredii]|uniref:class I SAM-dependent methyltransferase n=1 Tax=Rhizobium fredii TaxID=380 RepID=UPI0012FDF565|nr:class I SAM-dependent methyltransferase [Sinorhizobium fredii]